MDGMSDGVIFNNLEWHLTGFQGHGIFEVDYVKNIRFGDQWQSYYFTL